MGIYWKAVNKTKMEAIDPAHHGSWANKMGGIMCDAHPLGKMLVWALAHGWSGDSVEIVADEADQGRPGDYYDRGLKDVTVATLAEICRSHEQDADGWTGNALGVIQKARELYWSAKAKGE